MVAFEGSWWLRALSIAMEKCCYSPGIWISHIKSGIMWWHTVAIKHLVQNRLHSEAHCSPFLVAWCEFWHSSIVPLGTTDDGHCSVEHLSAFLASAMWQAAALISLFVRNIHVSFHGRIISLPTKVYWWCCMFPSIATITSGALGSKDFSMAIPGWNASYWLLHLVSPYWPSKALRAPGMKVWACMVVRGLTIWPTTFFRQDWGSHIGWWLCNSIVCSDCWVTMMCHSWRCVLLWSMPHQGGSDNWQWCICAWCICWGQNFPFKLCFYSVSQCLKPGQCFTEWVWIRILKW